MAARYQVDTNGDQALAAGTAETVLSIVNGANALIRLTELGISFDGVSAVAEPVTVELMGSTEATAGTSTTHTAQQTGGPTRTAQATAKRGFTAEPTVLTCWKRWLIHPQAGIVMQFPLGREPEQVTTADAIVIRVTAPAAVNVQGYLEWEEG